MIFERTAGADQPFATAWIACAAALLLAATALQVQAADHQVHVNQQATIELGEPISPPPDLATLSADPDADYSWLKDLHFEKGAATFTPIELGTHTFKYEVISVGPTLGERRHKKEVQVEVVE